MKPTLIPIDGPMAPLRQLKAKQIKWFPPMQSNSCNSSHRQILLTLGCWSPWWLLGYCSWGFETGELGECMLEVTWSYKLSAMATMWERESRVLLEHRLLLHLSFTTYQIQVTVGSNEAAWLGSHCSQERQSMMGFLEYWNLFYKCFSWIPWFSVPLNCPHDMIDISSSIIFNVDWIYVFSQKSCNPNCPFLYCSYIWHNSFEIFHKKSIFTFYSKEYGARVTVWSVVCLPTTCI